MNAARTNAAKTSSILVIGADVHFCYLLQRYVRESNHPLLFSGPDGTVLEISHREKPSLIILEDGLTDLKGQEMIRLLKTDPLTRQIPLALCSWHREETQESEDGADVYLPMPILFGDFLALLTKYGL